MHVFPVSCLSSTIHSYITHARAHLPGYKADYSNTNKPNPPRRRKKKEKGKKRPAAQRNAAANPKKMGQPQRPPKAHGIYRREETECIYEKTKEEQPAPLASQKRPGLTHIHAHVPSGFLVKEDEGGERDQDERQRRGEAIAAVVVLRRVRGRGRGRRRGLLRGGRGLLASGRGQSCGDV